MFCSECGAKACGKFCSACGCRLNAPESALVLRDEDFLAETSDWEHDCHYERLVRVEAVRAAIRRNEQAAGKTVSGEAFLELFDKLLASPVPLASLAGVVQPLYDSLGIRITREQTGWIDAPVGRTIARVLCSLAKRGQPVQQADQSASGCELTAELPSSLCALKGRVLIAISGFPLRTRVTATITIPGQAVDWGKSQRALESLFSDITGDLGLPAGTPSKQVA